MGVTVTKDGPAVHQLQQGLQDKCLWEDLDLERFYL